MKSLFLISVLLCSACQHDIPVTNPSICPTVKEYTSEFKVSLQAEVVKLNGDNPIVVALGDYITLRKQALACAGKKAARLDTTVADAP